MSQTILIADDNERNRKLFHDLLQVHGFRTLETRDGQTAVEMAQERRPDLILLDIQMPVLSGLEALARLKADRRSSEIPTVAVTSFAMRGDKERFAAAGFDAVMIKPVDLRELVKTIVALLERPPAK